MNKQTLKHLALAIMAGIMLASCANVKEYQKSRINDAEMILGNRKVEKNEINFPSYREGASGATGCKNRGAGGCL